MRAEAATAGRSFTERFASREAQRAALPDEHVRNEILVGRTPKAAWDSGLVNRDLELG